MAKTCPMCKVEKRGLCIHQKMIIGMALIAVVVVRVLLGLRLG